MAGPVVMSAPSVISAVWFPPKQRTTATAVTAMSTHWGVAVSFVLGPMLVSDYQTSNGTSNWSNILLRYIGHLSKFACNNSIRIVYLLLSLRCSPSNHHVHNVTDNLGAHMFCICACM